MPTKATKQSKLGTPVTDLAGVGAAYAEKLERLGITTVNDLLHYFPRRYEDLRDVKSLEELQRFGGLLGGQPVTLRAAIQQVDSRRTRFGKVLVKALIGNDKGTIEAVWFNQPYLAKQLKEGDEFIFSGKLKTGYGRPSLQNPSHEPIKGEQTHTARLVPVYPETEGLSSKWLRAKLKPLLGLADEVPDALPQDLRQRYELAETAEALRQIHFPDGPEQAERARYRFDFEQLLTIQLLTQTSRRAWQEADGAAQVPYDPDITKRFTKTLPWPLTDDQRLSAHEVLGDLDATKPMLRLLQGDVGSGKTVVAAIALHQAVAAGWQAALMVPTEVLANQHAKTLRDWFGRLDIETVVLLGSQSAPEKREAITAIESGRPAVIVGTHALIQEKVSWSKLALAVVDEQHRFGVAQRNALKGETTPHLLTMTATPIPRSLALTAYGDQDLSVIATPPAGRKPVGTKLILPAERGPAFEEIKKELAAGRQAFIVYPVIEDSTRGLKDATSEYERLSGSVLADFSVELLHGRMPADQKAEVMRRFSSGEVDALVSTSVIEVGVDIPNASVMVIEEAQQFGLAQLHQFRGRVGRGSEQSYCYLFAGDLTGEDNERLQAMTESQSGFDLAEVDLKLRGPGDLIGTKQSGFDVSLAALTNPTLLKQTREAAKELLQADPKLKSVPQLADRLEAVHLRS